MPCRGVENEESAIMAILSNATAPPMLVAVILLFGLGSFAVKQIVVINSPYSAIKCDNNPTSLPLPICHEGTCSKIL